MNYLEFVFKSETNEDYRRDLLIGALSEAGFDTFEETEAGFNAYVPENELDEAALVQVLADYGAGFTFVRNLVPQKNWNAEWESNFEPLVIGNSCYVRATFHAPRPDFPYEIIIDPKMAFGTGHHQTTALMIEFLLETQLEGKRLLDMGCGTGILAILAAKLGATNVTAIDNDPLCYDSTLENAQLNNVELKALLGSKEAVPQEKFDVIVANINRNILLDQLERYSEALEVNGLLFMSGFYDGSDLEIFSKKSRELNLTYVLHRSNNHWTAVKFVYGYGQ